jgi:nucleotide-binding universal stress UspA family protein
MFPTKILLATDGSAEATRAARLAITLSEKLDSELHVAYVEPLPDPYANPESITYHLEHRDEIRKIAERAARERLDNKAERIREIGEVAGAHARIGRPDAEIARLAKEIGAGLVVVGSRGWGPLKRAAMGSISESVVRHAHCPVLVVRGYGDEEKDYLPGRILLAFDGSEEANAAARAAVEIASGTGSELHVLHVLQPERYMPYHSGPEAWEWEANLARAKRLARSRVDEQAKRMETEGVMVAGTHVAVGKPDHEIIASGEELDASLVVMGSRGLSRLDRALMGSVSDSVVRHARCSVLVVRGGNHRSDAVARTEEEQAQS